MADDHERTAFRQFPGSRCATRLVRRRGTVRASRSGLLALLGGMSLIGLPFSASAQTTVSPLRAGAAEVDITPEQATLPRGDVIRDHLFVRALVARNDTTCAVFVGADQAGLPTPLVDAVVARLGKAINCPAKNFVISATHTHSASARLVRGGGDRKLEDAIVRAVTNASAAIRPARVGFGTTNVDLNVNRDLFVGNKWIQGTNPAGTSDKTLAVIEFIDDQDRPIGVYVDYAMHPVNFFMSGVISADFAGETSRYVERRFAGSVVIFAQGASGDQNPRDTRAMIRLIGTRARVAAMTDDRITAPNGWLAVDQAGDTSKQLEFPIRPEEERAYGAAIQDAGEVVTAMGATIGEATINVMRNGIHDLSARVSISAQTTSVSCPGRDRMDDGMPNRQGSAPPYKDGVPVDIKVGVLRLGDVYLASVDGEVYNGIATRLKREAPVSDLVMVTLANGMANSGYIYSNDAASHLTFQVVGSRLKPGCAEDGIVGAVLSMVRSPR